LINGIVFNHFYYGNWFAKFKNVYKKYT